MVHQHADPGTRIQWAKVPEYTTSLLEALSTYPAQSSLQLFTPKLQLSGVKKAANAALLRNITVDIFEIEEERIAKVAESVGRRLIA